MTNTKITEKPSMQEELLHLVTWKEDAGYLANDRLGFPIHTIYGASLVTLDHRDSGDDWSETLFLGRSTRSFQLAIAEALSEAYAYGHNSIVMPDGHIRRLRSSPARIERRADVAKLRRKQEEEARTRIEMIQAAAGVAARIDASPTGADILEFFRKWKSICGYGARPGKQEMMPILAPCKEKIIDRMIEIGRLQDWTMGIAHDAEAYNSFRSVIYIDTPHGQASFHVREGRYDLPPYPQPWSGKHDTPEIVAAIFDAAD